MAGELWPKGLPWLKLEKEEGDWLKEEGRNTGAAGGAAGVDDCCAAGRLAGADPWEAGREMVGREGREKGLFMFGILMLGKLRSLGSCGILRVGSRGSWNLGLCCLSLALCSLGPPLAALDLELAEPCLFTGFCWGGDVRRKLATCLNWLGRFFWSGLVFWLGCLFLVIGRFIFSILDFLTKASLPLLLVCWKLMGPLGRDAPPSLLLNPKGSARAAAAGKPERR